MSASLVGSEMCIRDRCCTSGRGLPIGKACPGPSRSGPPRPARAAQPRSCLLYTSDAADDM
eukprot:6421766-Alexandrium_andersonii.AAC.1